ncbi:hypothetical protein [Haladaptatus sp. YSMS36]|uniref:hypothetical protein n=1 Tax=Haladaptatus sp. YSMS36 TaxID=3033384 RepID=UPI0023E7EC2F|nr:hypothetical protein [Haladaptatus sp. YSMS36]
MHYFYTDDREAAAVLSVARLDDALTLWQRATPEANMPGHSILENARSSVQNYLDTVSTFATPSDDALNELEARRRTMYGVIRADARQWPSTSEEEDRTASDE